MKKALTVTAAAMFILTLSFTVFAADIMPQTGGIGTRIFYVVGGLLVVVAVIILFVRSRMK